MIIRIPTPTPAMLAFVIALGLVVSGSTALGANTANPGAPLPQTNIVKPAPGPYPSMYDKNIVVAFYGHPFSTKMGVLGEGTMASMVAKLKEQAAVYDALNGDEGVIPAFHLIYATIHPAGNTTRLSDEVTLKFIQYAMREGVIVVLDHQLGNSSVTESVKTMLPWLHWPNVHLAIDPEWRTSIPNKEIGSIDSSELNAAMDLVQNYLVSNGIEQRKMFMVHQFFHRMITNRDKVKAAPDRLDLIHNADGFGHPGLKMETYRFIAQAKNMPLKGFKLFYPKSWKSAGYDAPLMTPKDVLAINPRPIFINYQ